MQGTFVLSGIMSLLKTWNRENKNTPNALLSKALKRMRPGKLKNLKNDLILVYFVVIFC